MPESARRQTDRQPVQEILARFRETWRAAAPLTQSVDLAPFLPRESPLRLEVLTGLIAVDLDMRCGRKQSIGLEYYLEQFPELGTAATVPPELVYEEYAARLRHGESPALDEYNRRFPKQFPQFLTILDSESTPTLSTSKEGAVPETQLPVGEPTPGRNPPRDVVVFLAEKGYRLFEKLGRGGAGEVYRALAPGGIEVAVKVIRRHIGEHGMGNREQDALELIKGLRHPFLLQTQASWSLEDCLLIVMELADGTLTAASRPSHEELLRIFREAAEAIDYLNEKQIQHRDIKPNNILLLKGHAKVADFGLARLLRTGEQTTQSGAGTPAYMAPEVLSGKFNTHSDQFSLALSYVELRRGHKVYPDRGPNMVAFLHDRLSRAPDLSGLGAAETRVVLRALSKVPEARYPTCVAFVSALEDAAKPSRPPVRRWVWASVVLTLLVSILLLLLFWPRRPEVDWLPADVEQAPGATIKTVGGKRYYDRVVKIKNGQRVPFRLIPREKESDPATFYLMENKVSNELFQAAVADPLFQSLLDGFARDHPWTVQRKWGLGGVADLKDMTDSDGTLPVLRVTVTEAHCWARWLGGRLPTASEWDKAAGRLNGFPAPYRDADNPANPARPGQIAFGRPHEGPMPVGKAERDESPFFCRDMSGNGLEWTCTLSQGDRRVPVENPEENMLVVIRGREYYLPTPLRFNEHPDGNLNAYDDALPTTGFRVALELAPAP